MRCPRLPVAVIAGLTAVLQACGGGSSAPAGNGSVALRPLWQGGGGQGSGVAECGGGFGPEVPADVTTARIIFRSDGGAGSCCTAVRRDGSSFARRVVLVDLTNGNATVAVDGFAAVNVPDAGLPQCTTSAENPGAACGGGSAEPNYIGEPAPVTVVEGLIVNVGNLCIRRRPVSTATPTTTITTAPTNTTMPTFTATPSLTPPTSGATATITPTDTPSPTATGTSSESPTATPTATPTDTETETPTPSPTPSQVTLTIGSATGAAGQTVSIAVVISTAGQLVDATQNDILLAANAPIASTSTGEPDCTSTTGNAAAAFLPTGCSPPTIRGLPVCTTVRLTYAREQVPDATVLYTCNVAINADAPPGPVGLVCENANYVDSMDNQFPALCTAGTIVVQ